MRTKVLDVMELETCIGRTSWTYTDIDLTDPNLNLNDFPVGSSGSGGGGWATLALDTIR